LLGRLVVRPVVDRLLAEQLPDGGRWPLEGETMAKAVLIISVALLAVSAPRLTVMGRELAIDAAIRDRYAVERVVSSAKGMEGGALRAVIGGHLVELVDDRPFLADEPFKVNDRRERGLVSIAVDGVVTSSPVPAIIRLHRRDANRYWGFVYLMRLLDRDGPERLVVAQNLGEGEYRTVSIFADGRVVEDRFSYPERCSPPVRAWLIRYVVAHPSGYCSDLMQVWPSLFYPVLHPWVSGLAGLVGVAVGGTKWLRRRAARRAGE
jgi:hypothetical protein